MTPPRLTSRLITTPHGFFTRHGGVSTGPFASLNCSLSSPDDPANVTENRARVARALGAAHLVGVHQVHGAAVVTVTAPWPQGQGEKADAMVTNQPGIALGIITADCTPILLHDPQAGVIGAVHAGWRSAVAGVLEATVAAMQALGATSIKAAIGPCIRQPSYEVGPDLRQAVLEATPNKTVIPTPTQTVIPGLDPGISPQEATPHHFFTQTDPDRWHFDLPAYCAHRLQALTQIETIEADTYTDVSRFFSHRRRTHAGGHPIGHQISAITL